MTTVGVREPLTLLSIRQAARRNPEYGAGLAVVVAWAVVIGLHGGPVELTPAGHHHGADSPAPVPSVLLWIVMCVAMMVPTALPAVRHVGTNSLRWRRQRAIAEFLVPYIGVWTVFGLVALPALTLVGGPPGNTVLAAALGVAAGWQVLPYQRRFLRACHRTVPLPPRGRPAFVGCARFGLRYGRACLGVCGPLMLVMAVVIHETVLWMVVLTAISAALKLVPQSKRMSEPIALALGAGAAIFFII